MASENYNLLIKNLSELKLNQIKEYLPLYLEENTSNNISMVDSLLKLTSEELSFRKKGQ